MKISKLIGATLASAALVSCNTAGGSTDFHTTADCPDTLTHHARYLTLADHGRGFVQADIALPWQKDSAPVRYALVHRDSTLPENLPADMHIVRVPLHKAAVFSAVHTSALNELGALDCIAAVADAAYFAPADTICRLLEAGKVADAGLSTAPTTEVLAANGIEAVLRSPSQGQNMRLPRNVTAIECADYLETTPIGRAEWILLLGELTNQRQKAQHIFETVIENYSDIAFKVAGAQSPKPKILSETIVSGVWYVPAGGSYMARMYADAGGVWPWADTDGTGSLTLSLENVSQRAIDADIWLLRTYGYEADATTLLEQEPRYAAFKPLKEGNIYSCNSAEKPIFDDAAFHPDRVLAEYAAIFHPEVMPGYKLRYFTRQNK